MASWTSEVPAEDRLAGGGPTIVIDRRELVRLGLCRLAHDALGAPALPAVDPAAACAMVTALGGTAGLVLLGLLPGDAVQESVTASREATGAPVAVMVLGCNANLIGPAVAAGADGVLALDIVDHAALHELVAAIDRGDQFVAPELAGCLPRRAAAAQLSERCIAVLRCLADGLHDDEVAAVLNLSTSAVRKHVRAAEAKLHARTRNEAIARAVRAGLL